jgi:hypothetical protein
MQVELCEIPFAGAPGILRSEAYLGNVLIFVNVVIASEALHRMVFRAKCGNLLTLDRPCDFEVIDRLVASASNRS